MMGKRHWEDWTNLALGLWLFASPWALRFINGERQVVGDFLVMGPFLVLLALAALYMHRIWEERISLLLGLWLVVSPWVLGFDYADGPTLNSVLVGTIVGALSISALEKDKMDRERARRQQADRRLAL